jgi:hypothetical protein
MSIGRRCCVLPLILFALVAGAEAQQPSAQLAALLAKLPAETPAVRAELLILGAEDIRTLLAMLKSLGRARTRRSGWLCTGWHSPSRIRSAPLSARRISMR